MKLSPYQKALAYIFLLGLLLLFVFLFIGIFIPSTEQLLAYGCITILIAMSISMVVIGFLQLQVAYKHGKPLAWYKQSEIPLGLGLLCFCMVFVVIGIFQFFTSGHPLQSIYYLEMAILILCALLALFFFALIGLIGRANSD